MPSLYKWQNYKIFFKFFHLDKNQKKLKESKLEYFIFKVGCRSIICNLQLC